MKIDGLKRMFLCSGQFKVKAGGLMRTPPWEWIFDLCFMDANDGIGGKEAG